MSARTLAVIPARGGSKGLPGKNLRELAGLPLIGHALELAARCPELTRTVVSTDDAQIESAARGLGADVAFLRPAELALDETPMWPVLQHALAEVERQEERAYDLLALLQPTTPFRLPDDVRRALRRIEPAHDADGIVSVSEPRFNPFADAVVERAGRLAFLLPEAAAVTRRQDAPRVLRINGMLYVFRTSFVRTAQDWQHGRLLLLELPEARAVDVDDEDDLLLAQALLDAGIVRLPWV